MLEPGTVAERKTSEGGGEFCLIAFGIEASATVIAGPIKETTPYAAKATEKSDNQNNK
jgi:hypothetical protein